MDQTYGPVITAVDAGHVQHGDRCVRCSSSERAKVTYPCQDILVARAQQRVYAERLRTRKADEAGRLSSLAVR